jgi:CBS domain containing-hemolysin-like protein
MIHNLVLIALSALLAVASYVDRIYSEMGKFLAREYQDNIDAWEELVEPRLRLGRESIALSASVLRQLTLTAICLLAGFRLYVGKTPSEILHLGWTDALRTAIELVLAILVFDRLVPQMLFTHTKGRWVVRVRWILQLLFYLILPVTLLLGLLLSIVALAEPEDDTSQEDSGEAMEALLEAGQEEGIIEASDRALVRSVVEFGDKVVREVMTPRPEIFAVPSTLTLREFTAAINEHAFSRVPVYSGTLDNITGIAFAHDLLKILDIEAATKTVFQIARPAAFVPETKPIADLLREMQREKQHMRIVIDEYGGVAGLVTIEDLIEAIVGDISDEHDTSEDLITPEQTSDGDWVVPGNFDLARLRELLFPAADESSIPDAAPSPTEGPGPVVAPEQYESTTVGGLVSELAGHIPLPGEVVEQEGLRLEVLASTDRRIDRVKIALTTPAGNV